MTHHESFHNEATTESTPLDLMIQVLDIHGFEGMASAIQILVNETMKIERSETLRAAPYERTNERQGYANGFKPKTLNTRIGKLELQVPQTRGVEFYPKSLERGVRSERALKLAVAEMYVQGVSTRKVTEITQELCGLDISSSQVSRCAQLLDEELRSWRERPLGKLSYLILDARYEKVRHGGSVIDCAVLIALGVLPNGKRTVLGVSVSLSEAEVHWREFLASLVKRGLHGVEMITSDAHEGLKAARKSVFPGVPWQRCQFHLQQNAVAYVPKVDMRSEVADDLRGVFNAPDRVEADRLLNLAIEKYRPKAPQAGRLDGAECARGAHCLYAADGASPTAANLQHARTTQQRDQASHPRRDPLSQRSIAPATGECRARRSR